jgi:NADH-quinone oxidoreductase subunit J
MELVAFYIFAAFAVISSLLVIGLRSPMHSVILLIVSFAALSGLYVLLDAPFTAVTQIIIYAGAIMVLFLFVVMLLNAHTEDEQPGPRIPGAIVKLGAFLSIVLAVEVVWALRRLGTTGFAPDQSGTDSITSVTRIGNALFTVHAFAFEVTSILIVVAMVGAVVIARKEH